MKSSCIIKHFEHYSPLTDDDKVLLDSLEKSPKEYRKNTSVWLQGEPSNHFYTVSQGWAYSYRNMEDGSRQILDVYVPGDVVGLREFAFNKRITGLMVMSDAVLCAFPKSRLTEVFAESLLLCSIFFMISAADQAILLERLVNLGRRSARQKLAHFLLEISKRLEKTNIDVTNHLQLPLTQTILADALGLSAVHVNRVFKELREEKLVGQINGNIKLLNVAGLREVAGFDGTYLEENIEPMLQQARQMQGRIDGAGGANISDLNLVANH
ncbi:Crp/Fnr family transcriptional regulator [Marinobacter fonticola]|uniref:Crp/Fnr family transcriptional regulator n=1 Tax=Marinobacter fonticola TaxID=2603215 RepID=UPI0011E7C99F|nr:Crp/Fnr family transcriptional regulator [Marinobacter fonticola]